VTIRGYGKCSFVKEVGRAERMGLLPVINFNAMDKDNIGIIESTYKIGVAKIEALVFVPPLLLCGVLWRTVDPSFWEHISKQTPKTALWAIAGLFLWSNVAIIAWFLRFKKYFSDLTALKLFEGILWSRSKEPYCKKHGTRLDRTDYYELHGFPNVTVEWGWWCDHCNTFRSAYDDDGRVLGKDETYEKLAIWNWDDAPLFVQRTKWVD